MDWKASMTTRQCDRAFIRLSNYAKGMGIKLNIKKYDGDGGWLASRRTINLDEELEGTELIATFLHELGHHLADILYYKKGWEFLNLSYDKVYKDKKPTKGQLRTVLICERRAWDCGEVIAEMLRLEIGPWYYKSRNEALKDYKSTKVKK